MNNKEKLRQSVNNLKKLKITQLQIVEAISTKTRKPCSDRTFRTWLASPDNVGTSVLCPDWVIEVVEEFEKEVEKKLDKSN